MARINVEDVRMIDETDDDIFSNTTNSTSFDEAEEIHEFDAYASLFLNVTIIGCLLLAYYVRLHRIYCLPESAGAMLVGVVVGGFARLTTDRTQLLEFSPELFFFVLLPPIIFEAGYSLKRKHFFENIGAITLYAMFGTIISTFLVGGLTFYAAKIGLIRDIDGQNPMEALLFGALISAVDPVATLSIMGSAELQCDQLLYSLVFGESVLNDAIAIVLFKTFHKYYNPDGPDWSESEIPAALTSFVTVSLLSILVGVGLGLVSSFIYKHTSLSDFPKLETSLLFCFCYLCYSTAEAIELSGIMALFFNGIVLSHYNSYNLSEEAHVASEQIFATVATITETVVFLYMGMGVSLGRFDGFDLWFSLLALLFCLMGRALNIFPLSLMANQCRRRRNNTIPLKMQCVLWFAGLRGAIAFALAENMPGPNKDIYASTTLFICIFTTVVCGGFTERMLSHFGMKRGSNHVMDDDEDDEELESVISSYPRVNEASTYAYQGLKKFWKDLDDEYLKTYFGGSSRVRSPNQRQSLGHDTSNRGNYELTFPQEVDQEDD